MSDDAIQPAANRGAITALRHSRDPDGRRSTAQSPMSRLPRICRVASRRAQDQINWVLTSYIAAAAIMTPPTGFPRQSLSD